MRLFLDTNVTLDVLARRQPWLHDSATVLSLLESDAFDGIVAVHSITTLYYLCVKELGREPEKNTPDTNTLVSRTRRQTNS